MRRAFYRWWLLWLGVPGLVFLLWVWWDSGRNMSTVIFDWGKQRHSGRVAGGRVMWDCTVHAGSPGDELYYTADRNVMMDRFVVRKRGFEFPRSYEWKSYEVPGFHGRICETEIALWVIVPGYVVVWLGVVIAWEWRKARAMKDLTESESEMRAEVRG